MRLKIIYNEGGFDAAPNDEEPSRLDLNRYLAANLFSSALNQNILKNANFGNYSAGKDDTTTDPAFDWFKKQQQQQREVRI